MVTKFRGRCLLKWGKTAKANLIINQMCSYTNLYKKVCFKPHNAGESTSGVQNILLDGLWHCHSRFVSYFIEKHISYVIPNQIPKLNNLINTNHQFVLWNYMQITTREAISGDSYGKELNGCWWMNGYFHFIAIYSTLEPDVITQFLQQFNS